MAINAATRALADEVAKLKTIEIDKKTGTPVVDKESFAKFLTVHPNPLSLSIEQLQAAQDINTDYVAVHGLVIGEQGTEAMKKNKDLDRIDVTLPMVGKDKVDYSFRREVSYANPSQPGENLVKHGVMRTTLTVTAGNNSGQLGAVLKHLKDIAEQELANA